MAIPKFKMLQNLVDKLKSDNKRNIDRTFSGIRAFSTEKHEEEFRFDKANKRF